MSANSACPFCRIVSGEWSCHRIFEDEISLAFLDINPVTQGHLLLLPKQHVETLDQLDAELAAEVMKHLPMLARKIRLGLGVQDFNLIQNNGRLAGQSVPHVHFHLIPRQPGDTFSYDWNTTRLEPATATELLGKLNSV